MKRFAQCGPLPPTLIPPLCNQLVEQGFSIEGTMFGGMVQVENREKILTANNGGRSPVETVPLNYVLFSKIVADGEELPAPKIDLPGVEIQPR